MCHWVPFFAHICKCLHVLCERGLVTKVWVSSVGPPTLLKPLKRPSCASSAVDDHSTSHTVTAWTWTPWVAQSGGCHRERHATRIRPSDDTGRSVEHRCAVQLKQLQVVTPDGWRAVCPVVDEAHYCQSFREAGTGKQHPVSVGTAYYSY